MAELYTRGEGICEEPNYCAQDFSLFDLLNSQRNAHVNGILFLQPDSLEFLEYIELWRASYKKMEFPLEDIDQKIARLASSCIKIDSETRHLLVKETGFAALKLPNRNGCPMDNIITDRKLNLACNINIGKRVVEVFPYNNEEGNSQWMYFYDAAKVEATNRFRYSGLLMEALQEFQQHNFIFNRMRWPTSSDRVNRTCDSAKGFGLIVSEDITLNELFDTE